jgi:DNA-directed RNA polymerase specialized sigma24 family protein
VDEEELRQVLLGLLEDRLDVRIMHLMRETTCQSEVAKRLGVSQGLVRHRFIRTVNRMRRFPALDPFVRLYDFISANLNILREVQRPEWDIAYVID